MKRTLGACCALLVFAGSAPAQAPSGGAALDRLVGPWVLRGTLMGNETIHDVEVAWVLDHEYLRLHEVSREKDAVGKPAYEAIVYLSWDAKAGEYSCLWLDTTMGGGLSATGIGHAKPQVDGTIPFVFSMSVDEQFHNTFRYDERADSWQWIMDNDRNGALRSFGRVRLTRN